MAAAASGVSGVMVHGLADDEYGAVFDSAEKALEVEAVPADLLRRSEGRGDGRERAVVQSRATRRRSPRPRSGSLASSFGSSTRRGAPAM